MTTENIVKLAGEISDIAFSNGIDDDAVSEKFFSMIESDESSLEVIKQSLEHDESGDNRRVKD